MRQVKISLAQMKINEVFDENVRKTFDIIDEAHVEGSNIICFPEIHFSPFFPQYPRQKRPYEYAISTRHVILKELMEKAEEYEMVIVPNIYEKSRGRYYDTSPVIDASGELLGVSRMVHIMQAKHFYEQDYYAPSKTGFKAYDTRYGKIGVVICFDRHFPESNRIMALAGAELVVIPTANIKSEPLDLFEWEMRIAAFHNNIYVAMVNRVGKESNMDFCGESIIVDPYGNLVEKADDKEQLLTAKIDLDLVKKSREERPYLKLRRPEHYRKIINRSIDGSMR